MSNLVTTPSLSSSAIHHPPPLLHPQPRTIIHHPLHQQASTVIRHSLHPQPSTVIPHPLHRQQNIIICHTLYRIRELSSATLLRITGKTPDIKVLTPHHSFWQELIFVSFDLNQVKLCGCNWEFKFHELGSSSSINTQAKLEQQKIRLEGALLEF